MRIGTWNVERMFRGRKHVERYRSELINLNSDLLVVTEPGPKFRDLFPETVMSPMERKGAEDAEAWVAILGSRLEQVSYEIPYSRLAVAATTEIEGRNLIVYGSILPWNSAGHHAPDVYGSEKRPFIEIFRQALDEQVHDMKALREKYRDHSLVWAGDFNHTVEGRTLSRGASELLRAAIDSLGLKAVNANAPHRAEGMKSLDLVCVDSSWKCLGVESQFPESDGRPLSDHRWYVCEFE